MRRCGDPYADDTAIIHAATTLPPAGNANTVVAFGAAITTATAYSSPQAAAWPHVRDGSTVLIAEQTGSGKTLSYLLPLFDKLVAEKVPIRYGHGLASAPPTALRLARQLMRSHLISSHPISLRSPS
jgi:Rad3-related DNA helicase